MHQYLNHRFFLSLLCSCEGEKNFIFLIIAIPRTEMRFDLPQCCSNSSNFIKGFLAYFRLTCLNSCRKHKHELHKGLISQFIFITESKRSFLSV